MGIEPTPRPWKGRVRPLYYTRNCHNGIVFSMLEQVTEAIVLDKEPFGETHMRVHLFTKALGRVTAKATSARKITSKLNAHLEPLMVTTVRLVQKNHLPQVIDALQIKKLPAETLPPLRLIKELAAEYEPDDALYAACVGVSPNRRQSVRAILALLGYDPQFAACVACGKPPVFFSLSGLSFGCAACFTEGLDCVMFDGQ